MTVPERILRIPRVGVEHEYRWLLPKSALADRGASDDMRDRLRDVAGLVADDEATILQHTLCLDTEAWALSAAGCSLTALVSAGGPTWLVAKETVQWVNGRRDVLEMSEYAPDMRTMSSADVLEGRPGRYLLRRVAALRDVRVFGYLTQRRAKSTLRTDGSALVAISCDTVELRDPKSVLVDTFAVVEVETNQASRVDLHVLEEVADRFSELLGSPPAQTTKPQLAAVRLGWHQTDV
jgi:hypothetical protein